MRDRIVITGLGLISSLGNTQQAFSQNLAKGVSGIRPLTLFDVSKYPSKMAGEIPAFDARIYLGSTGIRHFDRTSLLLASAAKLALEDGGCTSDNVLRSSMGLAVGSTFGSISSIISFDSESVREGPAYVNPMDFPNTVLNAPAGRASIMHQVKGVCATISTGETSSLDALIYACDFLRLGRVDAMLAGGCYGLTEDIFGGFSRIGALAGSSEGQLEISAPFDRRRNGIILGEGSCLFLVEKLEDARARGAKIYAEINGYATGFTSLRANNLSAPRKAIQTALQEAELPKEAIQGIFAGANSSEAGDRLESQLIKETFGVRAKSIPITAVKSELGECLDVGGAFQVAAGIMALNEQIIPPTINYAQPDPACDLDYVPNECREVALENILISSFSPTGHNSFMILSRLEL